MNEQPNSNKAKLSILKLPRSIHALHVVYLFNKLCTVCCCWVQMYKENLHFDKFKMKQSETYTDAWCVPALKHGHGSQWTRTYKKHTVHGIHSYIMLNHRNPTKVTHHIEIKSAAAMGSLPSKNCAIIRVGINRIFQNKSNNFD